MSKVIGFMKENVFQDSLSPTFFPSGELTTDLKWSVLILAWTSSRIPCSFCPHGQLREVRSIRHAMSLRTFDVMARIDTGHRLCNLNAY